ncbi:MAG: tRNA (N6-threonylcarbamoyladenosine(37)-N6)-methyltransferase TrmO [Prevotella sp.]|nr:tRNA (N6-threonylcarbamoyladenosine(37)-N6)-methyltransferase TrmO [Candidatus Prevotella equi]
MKQIATFHSPFQTKFGIPRQAGVVQTLSGTIVFEKDYRSIDAIRGMEDFDYLWLIWCFSANSHSAKGVTVRPPRLGGNKQLGVFATRSPFRPNPIGLSSVRIERIDYDCPDAPVIHVLGADLMDGTPIYDIKPYIPYTDSHPEARGGFTDSVSWQPLNVEIPEQISTLLTREGIDIETLREVLSQDPRPQYHNDADRVYGMPYGAHDIRFKVNDDTLTVIEIS